MIIRKIKFLFAILIVTSLTVSVTVCQNRQPENAEKPQPKVLPRIENLDKAQTFQNEDFVSGWLPNENSSEVWGRPVGLPVNSDGSLLIADDGAKKIWRVSYRK